MARKPRIHLPGGFYHVIFRGNDGQDVFLIPEDRYRFYLLLQEGTCRFDYGVHAFCLMTNHIHLLLQSGDIPLSRGMQNLSLRYTRWINWKNKRTGHLFQGRYKSVLVDADNHLLELVRYLHLNPLRAGMVAHADDYPWSSHGAYLGKETLPWLTTEPILVQFGGTVGQARKRYRSFVLDGLEEGHRPEFHGGKDDSRIIGSEDFVKACLVHSEGTRCRVSLEKIVPVVCRRYEITLEMLASSTQQRTVSEARAVLGWLALELGAATLSKVGRLVNRDVGSVSSAVRRLTERMEEIPVVAARVKDLRAELLVQPEEEDTR